MALAALSSLSVVVAARGVGGLERVVIWNVSRVLSSVVLIWVGSSELDGVGSVVGSVGAGPGGLLWMLLPAVVAVAWYVA